MAITLFDLIADHRASDRAANCGDGITGSMTDLMSQYTAQEATDERAGNSTTLVFSLHDIDGINHTAAVIGLSARWNVLIGRIILI